MTMRPWKTFASGLGLLPYAISSHHSHPSSGPFLNFSSPAPYIFSSINGLFQQWSNAFFPNGHSIAACEIPAHSLFYHGRHDAGSPPSPEWLAFDVEMAYGIMGSLPDSRMLTYRTTRAIKCLYFDGMSANLASDGIETQMTFLYGDSGSIPPHPGPPRRRPGPDSREDGRPPFGRWNPLDDEYFRAQGLCKWIKEKGLGGLGWGFEGVVRMNAGFELIWCDFDSPSLRLVSNLNVSAPRIDMQKQRRLDLRDQVALGEGPHGPGMTDPSEPFRQVANWMWFTAAARRYGSSGTHGVGPGRGEARAKVNTCGIFSFYDPALQGQDAARIEAERAALNISSGGQWHGPEQVELRAPALEKLMRRRRPHRANHVSKEDGEYMRAAVETMLRAVVNGNSCSGIDWQLTTQEIVAFYGANLANLVQTLDQIAEQSGKDWLTMRNWLESVRTVTHWFMMPFLEYPRGPYTNESLPADFSLDSPAMEAALERC